MKRARECTGERLACSRKKLTNIQAQDGISAIFLVVEREKGIIIYEKLQKGEANKTYTKLE